MEKKPDKDILLDKKVLRVQSSTKLKISTISEFSQEKKTHFSYAGAMINIYKHTE